MRASKEIKKLSCLAIRLGLAMPVEETGDALRDALEAEMRRREALVADLPIETRRRIVAKAWEESSRWQSWSGLSVILSLPLQIDAISYLSKGSIYADMNQILRIIWREEQPLDVVDNVCPVIENLWRLAVGEELIG